jgi:hypothetical protein
VGVAASGDPQGEEPADGRQSLIRGQRERYPKPRPFSMASGNKQIVYN